MDALYHPVFDPQAAPAAGQAAHGALLRGLSPDPAGAPLARTRSGRPMNNLELVENLCALSPELREARRAHVARFGVLIPHVFMGDVLGCIGARLSLETVAGLAEVVALLAALEEGMKNGDRETRNVIALSFVRDGELEAFFPELRRLLGPRTQSQVRGR